MDKYASDYGQKPLHMSAHGNAWTEDYQFTGTAADGDKIYLGVIPAGVRVTGIRLIHGAAGEDAAADLGFEPLEDGTPEAATDYFLAGEDVAAAGVAESAALPITFNRPVKLVLTADGDFASGTIAAIVTGNTLGAP